MLLYEPFHCCRNFRHRMLLLKHSLEHQHHIYLCLLILHLFTTRFQVWFTNYVVLCIIKFVRECGWEPRRLWANRERRKIMYKNEREFVTLCYIKESVRLCKLRYQSTCIPRYYIKLEILVGPASTTTRKVGSIDELARWWGWNSNVASSSTLNLVIGFEPLSTSYKAQLQATCRQTSA